MTALPLHHQDRIENIGYATKALPGMTYLKMMFIKSDICDQVSKEERLTLQSQWIQSPLGETRRIPGYTISSLISRNISSWKAQTLWDILGELVKKEIHPNLGNTDEIW